MATDAIQPSKWIETTKGRIVGATAIVAALVGLINGGIDLYKSILKMPDNIYDRTNGELFAKHFNKTPIVSQPVQIKSSSLSVEMLLQVYESGDVFVRYGEFQQWLPFRKPKVAEFSFFPQAFAQTDIRPSAQPHTSPQAQLPNSKWQRVEQLNVPPIIDIDRISKSQTSTASAKPTESWSKAFVVSEIQQERAAFTPTTKNYERLFSADAGYRFTKVDIDLGSANNARVNAAEIIDNGKLIRVQYQLTSGPIFDQYRGWIHATVKTEQEKVK